MTEFTKDEIIAWAIQAGLDQEFWLAESHPNFDNEMQMLTAFAHLCRTRDYRRTEMKCGKPYCTCVGQCFAQVSPLDDNLNLKASND